jgi:arylsulfatase A-like enzyme
MRSGRRAQTSDSRRSAAGWWGVRSDLFACSRRSRQAKTDTSEAFSDIIGVALESRQDDTRAPGENPVITRRSFLHTVSRGAAAVALCPSAAPSPKRPNIVVILADDMGFSDIGCYGSEIDTPNLDGLARAGVRFTHFRNTARCCPSRSSLLTGLYAHQAGVGLMVDDRGRPPYQGYLNDRCVTLAEVLRPAGYRTLMCGKWHVGEHRPHWPTDRGFDKYFGLISGACNYFRLDPERQMALDDKPWTPPSDGSFYMTNAIADHAVEMLDAAGRGAQPFFLYLAFTAPHYPLHALPQDIAKYEGRYMKGWDALRLERHRRMIEMGIVDARWPLTPRDPEAPAWDTVADKKAWDRRMAVYAAQIDRLDQNIGRVLRKIREIGAEDNTLVMFLADNGGCAEIVDRGKPGVPPGLPDSFMSYGIPWANASNTPFRLYKRWVHEGGVATPFIVRWPSGVKHRNTITHETGHLVDIMATCVDLAGAPYPGAPIQAMEGKSLVPVFQGRSIGDRILFWEHMGNRAALDGKWKLVSRYPNDWELYDLEADRTEMNDLVTRMPDKAAGLLNHYNRWAQRCGVAPWDEIRTRNKTSPGD